MISTDSGGHPLMLESLQAGQLPLSHFGNIKVLMLSLLINKGENVFPSLDGKKVSDCKTL